MARRPTDYRAAAEAVFKRPAPKVEAPKAPAAVPQGKETVTLKIDRDVLAAFQEDGPGWQDRINAALRQSAGL
ncbi:BrnA antitoxin family protein [Amorphus sp. 3PC139-8]|uniref:BrnA antitoxin family protein n=1 Tax=Amorphus sp. 3PC139-8 TaxID=2735676 RepID=UPI00345D89AC